MIKPEKNLVMIIGHKDPHFLIDTAESVRHYNPINNYEIVFAVDFNKDVGNELKIKYGPEKVFITHQVNGWGRGILRTIFHALDYFKPLNYRHVFTMDSDALCVGPFVDLMTRKADETTDVFFVGKVWYSPGKDHGYHRALRASGFMGEFPYYFRTEMAAGPCMLWTHHCINFCRTVGLLPGHAFDRIYPVIHFAHDQLSTYFVNCHAGRIERVDEIMEIRWREALPSFRSAHWGDIPSTYQHTAIIHPTQSHLYQEKNVREYFRQKRNNPNL